jgi:adenylate cyclase
VTCDVVNRLLERPDGLKLGGELRTVTILFCDIRGFSSLSESLSPEQVVAMLNAYLGSVCDVVEEHGGCVNEFIGDAVLASSCASPRSLERPDFGWRASSGSWTRRNAVEATATTNRARDLCHCSEPRTLRRRVRP